MFDEMRSITYQLNSDMLHPERYLELVSLENGDLQINLIEYLHEDMTSPAVDNRQVTNVGTMDSNEVPLSINELFGRE